MERAGRGAGREIERLRAGIEIGKKLLAGRDRQIATLEAQLSELQRSYDFMSGEAHKREQAEAQLARVVELLNRAGRPPDAHFVRMALAASQPEERR